jgi:hypothetical protein
VTKGLLFTGTAHLLAHQKRTIPKLKGFIRLEFLFFDFFSFAKA